ncbi:kinesin-like protein KIFC3 isoform X2 [Acropora muricata]|uniref:kinesin-like protein KIFC3 isoform X2 n=1 Tax=Acropora muricata TaxID=159855 RepID=UPI0034E4FB55
MLSPRDRSKNQSLQSPFKTPMAFKPDVAHKPSPSRKELWREELGLNDDSDLEEEQSSSGGEELETEADQATKGTSAEYQALLAEIKQKDKQREELLMKLKVMSDKTSNYRTKLQKAENNKKSQIKILKKTHESQLAMKGELIHNLEELIEEQESKIAELESHIKGSSTSQTVHVSNTKPSSIRKLVDSINDLHLEKSRIHETWLSTQSELETMKQEHSERVDHLSDNISELERELRKSQAEIIKLQNNEPIICNNNKNEDNSQMLALQDENGNLKKRVQTLEYEVQSTSKLHLNTKNQLEDELLGLRKKLRDAEARYTNLAATPPKTRTISVVSEETKKQLDQMILQNKELEGLLSKTRSDNDAKVSALQSDIKSLKENIKECVESEQKALAQSRTLQEHKNTLESTLLKKKNQIEALETEIVKCRTDIEQLGQEFEKELQDFQEQKRKLIEDERAKAERESRSMKSKLKHLKAQLQQIYPVLKQMKGEQQELRISSLKLGTNIKPAVRGVSQQIVNKIEAIDKKNKELVFKYKKEMTLRKKLHNELVDLKGNIRVYCRVRPLIKEDGGGKTAENVISFDEDDDGILNVLSKGTNKPFEMDKVFKPESTQEQVFEEVRSLIVSCIDGYNVCIFAYGQTGSGKTFTMEGSPSNPGINQRALILLFEETRDRSVDWQFAIHVSVIEIYNEMLRDLLGEDPSAKLDIRQGAEGLFVPGLTEIQVNDVDELNEVFSIGKTNRATAITDMNEHSSRSHALLCVTVIGTNKTTGQRTTGKLNLVDLAGSERVSKSGSEGARMKEAQNINKSLSSLGDVIHSLKNKNSHIPYRNSKLTYLLQESLGGDSKTLMVVQVSPVEKNVSETVCSLTFAQRVRTVELGQATKKTENAEMAGMRDRLRELEGTSSSPSASPARNGGLKSAKKLRY